jgi:glycosyltransferase involved in cell wall biosynthesis
VIPAPQSPWLLLSLSCAFGPVIMFGINLLFYRAPAPLGRIEPGAYLPHVSVLIPARNEEASIAAAVQSVLASRAVELDVQVLDDASLDATAAIVASLALQDARLRLHTAPLLPADWNGKQHACHVLSELAQNEWLCFLDADVRIAPDALARLIASAETQRVDLLSGFPFEETGTWLEQLLIPLIHFVLLCYLPLPGLRIFRRTRAFAAGCGQVMLTRRSAYQAVGGHAAIRSTMHDGILLPRLLRQSGFATGLVDLTGLARCRMYGNARQVWAGLGKNATEGMAAPTRIVPFTIMLLFGQVIPAFWFVFALAAHHSPFWPGLALAAGYLVRFVALLRFQQSLVGALLHPVGVTILLALQWWALGRRLLGRQAVWKQRVYDLG